MQRPTFLIVITLLCLTVTQAIAAAQSPKDKPKPNARKAAYIVGSDVAAAQSFDKVAVHSLKPALCDLSGWINFGAWTSSNSRMMFARGGSMGIGWWNSS